MVAPGQRVEIVDWDPAWADRFATTAADVADAFMDVDAIDHVGSTSVPGLAAKPVIDLLVTVSDIAIADAAVDAMAELGFEALGEFGLKDRRFFRRDDERGIRTDHVHCWAVGHGELDRHLAVRDYLDAHAEEAEAYASLKRALVARHDGDREAYIDGKDAFVKALEQRALAWWRQA